MNYILNLLEAVVVIGGSDNPTAIFFSANDLPLPAITLVIVVIALLIYTYTAKAIRAKKAVAAPEITAAAPAAPVVAPAAAPIAAPVQTGVELVGVDEQSAAVIMAIVSDKTGIPIERLSFKSIKLMEDK